MDIWMERWVSPLWDPQKSALVPLKPIRPHFCLFSICISHYIRIISLRALKSAISGKETPILRAESAQLGLNPPLFGQRPGRKWIPVEHLQHPQTGPQSPSSNCLSPWLRHKYEKSALYCTTKLYYLSQWPKK